MALVSIENVFVDMEADSIANTKLRNIHIQYSKKLNAGDRSRLTVREKGENKNDGEKEQGEIFLGGEGLSPTKKRKQFFISNLHITILLSLSATQYHISGDF